MIASLKIIELSTVLAGPAVGMFFAELGASVIKFEHPNLPDVTRSWKLASENKETNVSAYFSSVNYLKKLKKLDLSKAKDDPGFMELLKTSDIILMNFKKGDDIKFGLTSEYIHSVNPKMVIGKISGFGDDSDRVAYDLILQAESGFMSMNGTKDSGPVKMPVALIDVLAAHQLKEGILVALLERSVSGKGSVVSVSLYDAAVSSLMNQASNYLMEGHIPQRIGSLHPNIAPYGELFESADNKLITFAIGSDMHFRKLCDFLELPEIPDMEEYSVNVQRVKNRTYLAMILQEKIGKLNSNEISEAMNKIHVPAGIVRRLDEVFRDDAAKALIREEEIDGILTRRVTSVGFKLVCSDVTILDPLPKEEKRQ